MNERRLPMSWRNKLNLQRLDERITPTATTAKHDIGVPSDRVASFVVNGGASQRSKIYEVDINFNQQVALPADPSDAIHIVKRVGDNKYKDVKLAPTTVTQGENGNTIVRYVGPSSSDAIIIDGDYKIVMTARSLVGGATSAPNELLGEFWSLSGDGNGDGVVNQLDYNIFLNALGTTPSVPGYADFFDFDNNGAIDQVDYQYFLQQLGNSI
ncbi:MAG: dockerin type I domain-containing protein [Gemmataceae bacterium]